MHIVTQYYYTKDDKLEPQIPGHFLWPWVYLH